MFSYLIFRLDFYKDTKQILKTWKLLNMLEISETIKHIYVYIISLRMYDI